MPGVLCPVLVSPVHEGYFHTMYLGIRSRQSGENDRWRFYWKMVYEYADKSVSPAFALSTAALPGTGVYQTMGNASPGEAREVGQGFEESDVPGSSSARGRDLELEDL
ncbi:hypothetical protein DUI87_07583 [Hirundo rustica rustica]|uniref:Uncharacterized protein n=1 Tax=Hirundo rustica rustica TaxID=333673 RepID=A0A3M0KQ26_HIRRU|nr:hypothetical protein DUI87_07583 [Hirundo rustica rustica]